MAAANGDPGAGGTWRSAWPVPPKCLTTIASTPGIRSTRAWPASTLTRCTRNQPVREGRPAGQSWQKPAPNVRIVSSQERIYVAGTRPCCSPSAQLTTPARRCRYRSRARSQFDPPKDGKPSQRNSVNLPFNDEGNAGDAAAADGARVCACHPQRRVFAGHFGVIRVELHFARLATRPVQVLRRVLHARSASDLGRWRT